MRSTPLDIIPKQFTPGKRGYDSEEVRAFLESVRESMEELAPIAKHVIHSGLGVRRIRGWRGVAPCWR